VTAEVAARLERLERQVRRDLSAIEVPPADWLRPRQGADGQRAYDVVIVGAGLSGLSIGFGLIRQRIDNFIIIDESEEGREGPWVTCARMAVLRSPKQLTGPDLGLPSLTFRSWYETVAGEPAWQALGKIPPGDWMAYLSWYRKVLRLPVRNRARLTAIAPAGDLLRLSVDHGEAAQSLYCRRVVLATGIDGSGKPAVPDIVAAGLHADRYTHSAEPIDPAVLIGRDIAVLGASSSAFDWANMALEAGARAVTLFARRRELTKTEALAWANFPGFLGAFSELDDVRRWRFMRRFFELQPPPTQEMYDRVIGHPGFAMVLGAPWTAVSLDADNRVAVDAAGKTWRFDHVLLGTGFATDLSFRQELAGFAADVALWGDRFSPPPGEEDPALARFPYLGPAFEMTEREPGRAPYLSRIHVFNNGAIASLGPVCNGVTGLKYGAPKIVAGIVRSFFLEDADSHLEALMGYDEPHFRAHDRLKESQDGSRAPL
jgi:FAD-dependent urate hydroxylase